MRTINQVVHRALQFTDNFEDWKYDLRHHDVTCDVVNLLDGLPQTTHYHPEYDALLHTYYVCRAVMQLPKKYTIKLLETAFLHDVGKGTTTNIGDKRIYHFGHPDASVKFIDTIKYRLKNYTLTRQLVHRHMNKPKEKIDGIFVRCDKVISKELFKEENRITTIWKNKLKEKVVHYKQRHAEKEIVVPIGISGSGKSTYLYKNYPAEIIVSPDAIRRELTGSISDQSMNSEVWPTAFQRLRITLERYGRAVLDATNVTKFLRVQSMSPFNDCRKIALVFDVDVDVAIERVNKDIESEVDRASVPEAVIRKQYKNFKKGLNSLKYEFNKVRYL